MLAIVDAWYRFIYVDVGTNGRASDATVWNNSSLRSCIENGTILLPEDSPLPGTNVSVPHVFIGDDAFPLKRYMMKPYPFRSQNRTQRIFSYRLSRARRTVENAFGILSNRFRVLTPIHLHPAKVEKLLLACVVLHNMLVKENSSHYSPSSSVDVENLDWPQSTSRLESRSLSSLDYNATGTVLTMKQNACERSSASISME